MKTHISIISKLTALLTSAAVISGIFPAMELMAAAETPAASSAVSLKKDIKSYGDGWFWNGESLLIYGASFDVPENTAYFGNFNGFAAGDTIKVLVEGLNEITLADGAVFVDSDQIPLSIDGSSYMKVSGSGVLFSGGAADYYGGVIDAQGEVTLFDAPSLAVEGGKVLAPDGAVISLDGGKAFSLDIKNANVKAKSYGADVISGSKSHLEFPEGCGETTDLKLNTCTAVINGTGFTTDFEFSKSVVIFPDIAAADDLSVVSDYSSYDTGKGGTVFCNEFVTSSDYYVDGRGLGVLSEGDHRGMYYDGDQPLIVRDGVTVSEANYITSPNTIVFAAGSMSAYYYSAKINYDDHAVAYAPIKRAPVKPVLLEPTNINDAVITAISTGKGVNDVFFHDNAISLYNVNMSGSSLFAGTTTEYNSINVCFAGSKDTSTSNDCTFIAIGDIRIGITFSILNNDLEKFSGIAIASGMFSAKPRLLDGRVTCDCSSYAYHMVIDGKVTETNAVSKSFEGSLQVRNGSFWCGVVGTRLTTTTKDPDEKLLVHPDAIDTTYIYAALKGTDKYYEYTQLARNEDNKIYIGRKIYEPYINIVEPENKTLTRGGTTEIAYVTYGCTDPVLEWVNADGDVISAPDGITASLGDTSIDRKVSITTDYDVPEETVRFRIRSRDGNNIVSNVLELTTGKYNFMMDFRDSQFRKKWKFGVEVTDPVNNYAGTNWRWYGKDTTENGVSYKAKTLVLEDGFSHVTDSEACRVGIALPDGATLIVAGDCEVQAYTMPIKCEGSLTVINSGDKRNTISLLFTYDGILEASPANPNTDQFQYPRIPGCFETAGDLSVTGCDIKSDVGSSQYLKAYGSMELADMSLTVPDGTPWAVPTALYAEGRLLIKPDVVLNTLPATIGFGSLKIGEVSELSELTDLSDNKVYGAEDLVSMPAASALYELSSAGNPLKLVTTPLTADNTLEKLQFCKDVYGASSGTIDLNDLGAVSGGSGKYKFAPVGSLPSWLTVTGDDSVKFDIPNNDMEQTSVKFTVTDADTELAISGDGAELTLNFGPVKKIYYVRYYKPENGTITVTSSASGKTVEISEASGRILCETPVISGEDAVVTIRPDRGFKTSGMEIDGSPVVPDKALSVEGTMTFSGIDADHSVSAVFTDTGAPGFEEYCTIALDSSLEDIADRFSLKYTESGKTVTRPLSEPQTVRTDTEIKIIADTGTEYYLENAVLGGDDVELQFDSDTMSFYCSLRLQKTAAFKADYGELCKVELSCDPDSSTVSSETRDFGGYIPKGDTYKFSILTKNKDTIAEVYNALDQSQKLEPVSVDRNEDERVYHYEWVITGDANWTPVIYPPRILTVNCGEHGTVTSADGTYANGDTVTLTVAADPGYYVKSTELNGTAVSLNSSNEYTFTIESDSTFTAEFAEVPPDACVVTVKCGEHGTVTPGTAEYEDGTVVTLTVAPDSGYRVKSVTLNGNPVKLTDGKYTFTVSADCTFEAVFQKVGSSGGSTRPGSPSEISRNPAINGVTKSWKDIAADIAKLPAGDYAAISLNGETSVPAECIRSIAASKVSIEFIVDSSRSWIVNGAEITSPVTADLSFLPGSADRTSLRGINGAAFRISGIGIPAALRLKFRREFAGQYANVYKLADSSLSYLDCVKVNESGCVDISGVHTAGEYVVMVCEYSDLSGDVNNDGVLNALDATALLKHIVGVSGEADMLFADFNGDGSVNTMDASAILKKIIGLP